MKTAEQIVVETVNRYGPDPPNRRALRPARARTRSTEVCDYFLPNGKCCAVGAYMLNPSDHAGEDPVCDWGSGTLDAVLVPQVRGLEQSFWEDIQYLHDDHENWCQQGLTRTGQIAIKRLCRDWGLNTASVFASISPYLPTWGA